MSELAIGLATAFWLGVLTSISPCPLATNIAAISYLSKTILQARLVLLSGIAYTLGRMAAYALVGFIIVASLLSIPVIAQFLQQYMNKILGPMLVLVGLLLLNVIKLGFSGFVLNASKQQQLARTGCFLGPLALGFVFALSFCPVSAGLFFGSLIPLALSSSFGEAYPFIYGIGTALPVLVFAVLIALGVQSLGRWIRGLQRLDLYARRVTGLLFIAVGLYYLWAYWLL